MASPKAISADDIDPIFDMNSVFEDNGVSLPRFRVQYKIKAGKYMRTLALQGQRRGEL